MISTDAIQGGFLTPSLFVNLGSSLTIFNEGMLLTIINETTSLTKNDRFNFIFCLRFHNETIVFQKIKMLISLITAQSEIFVIKDIRHIYHMIKPIM